MTTTVTETTKTPPPKALRTAKGKKPQYFSDPAIDKLLSIVISLAGELSVTRDRLDAVERLLEQHQVFNVADVDQYHPSAEVEEIRTEKRSRFIQRMMRVVEAELEEITGEDMPQSRKEILESLR
jgi:hypothetical protein